MKNSIVLISLIALSLSAFGNQGKKGNKGSGIQMEPSSIPLLKLKAPQSNKVYDFSGETAVDISSFINPNISKKNFSFSIWIQTNASNPQTLFWYDAPSGFFSLRLEDQFGKITFNVSDLTRGHSLRQISSLDVKPNDGNWHHIVAVKTNAYLELYFDGIMLESEVNRIYHDEFKMKENTEAYIGGISPNNSDELHSPFIGNMHDLSFFPNALSPHEINMLYNNMKLNLDS